MRRLSIVLLALVSLGSVGCSAARGLATSLAPGVGETAKSDSPRVSKILCLWEPGVGKIPNGPKRGVVGQVLFFSGNDVAPTKVDGSLVVYLFDDHGTVEQQTQPQQKLVLSSEDLQAVHADTAIGHSYHIPVPYAKTHNLETTCTLRVKYTSPSGEVTYSSLGSVYLEGAEAPKSRLTITRSAAPVSATKSAESTKNEVRMVGSTAIQKADAGANQLESLTIRRELPRQRRTQKVTEPTSPERPRRRFRLSNVTPNNEQGSPLADEFAPLSSAETGQ